MDKIYLPILMYHVLTNKEIANSYAVSTESFEEQLQYLYQNGFKSIIPEDIFYLKEENNIKPVMITFDDGYETDYTLALPILKKYGFRGVSFITTGFLEKKGYMNWLQVLRLKKEGFSIQSHTHTHPFLKANNERVIRQELSISKKFIEERLKTQVNSLSIPGGSYSKNIINIALEEGYQYIFNSKPNINIINNNIINFFGRVLIGQDTSLNTFKKIVTFKKNTYQQIKLIYYIKDFAKKSIGAKGYYRLWNKYNKSGEKQWL